MEQAATDLAMVYNIGPEQLFLAEGQTRAKAWLLRTLTEVDFVIPDDHALSGYFETVINNNLDYLVDRYIVQGTMDAAGELEGWFQQTSAVREVGSISSWQQDFLVLSLTVAAARGFDQGAALAEWASNFTAGRFISGDEGYDPLYGAPYLLAVFDPATGQPYDNWLDAFTASQANFYSSTADLAGASAGSYTSYARATLAQIITETGSPDAIEAYGFNYLANFWRRRIRSKFLFQLLRNSFMADGACIARWQHAVLGQDYPFKRRH